MIKRPVKRTPRKRLRATAQRSVPKYAEDDFSAEEPNVKLSRAFVVVLLLHVIAVGGIFAFSALKDRQGSALDEKGTGKDQSTFTDTERSSNELRPAANKLRKVKAGETLASIASQYGLTVRDLEQANNLPPGSSLPSGKELTIPSQSSVKPVPLEVQKLVGTSIQNDSAGVSQMTDSRPKSPEEGGKTYIVQRGDSPAAIARKFKINSADLLKANNVEDPKRLKIGQKLIIPVRK